MKTVAFASLLLGLLTALPAGAFTLYVAPEGRDDWSGQAERPAADGADGPLRSLHGARDALRRLRTAGKLPAEEVRVIIAGGEYPLTEALVLEPQDSGRAGAPVSFEAQPGARPLFTGGRRITGWTQQPDGLWRAEIPEVREGKWKIEQLWINGQRAVRARTPNEDYFQAAGAATEPVPGVKPAGPLDHVALNLRPEDVAALKGLSPAELHDVNATVYHSWNVSRHRIAGVNPETGTLQFTGPARWAFFQLEPYHRVVLENYRAALDAPGEWFLDAQGVLLYQPRAGEEIGKVEAIAPVTPQWLVIRGDAEGARVEHLRFSGLHFAHSQFLLSETGWNDSQADAALEAAIMANGGSDLTFEDCEFEHTAAYTIWLHHGCRDSRVLRCHLHEMGAGGVKIGETAVPKTEAARTGGIQVENCIIQEGGRLFTGSIGVWIGHSGDNAIAHCDIGDFYYSAISIGWVWGFGPSLAARNRVEWNHLHHLGWGVLSDMGAVYTLGVSPGTVIRHNTVHDIACYSYGGWGLYPDEGSTGLLLEDNLVYRTESGGFHQHYGKENMVRNNIFAYAREFQVRHSRSEDHLAFAFERNIVLWKEGQLLGHLNAGWQGRQVWLAQNLYWQTAREPFTFAGKSMADWQASGQDVDSVVADPMFVDPEHGDFHLRPGSPAAKIGFHPFDFTRAGVEGDPAWVALAAARQYPPMSFEELKLEPAPLTFREGFEFSKLAERMGPLRLQTGGVPDALRIVTDRPAQGTHCLELTDSPAAKPGYNPHLYCVPRHRHGTSIFSFALRVDDVYDLSLEWRDNATPYHTGPAFRVNHRALSVGGKKLADLPANEWVQVEMEAGVGEQAAGAWTLTLTVPGQEPQKFTSLGYGHAAWKTLEWLGLSSPGSVDAHCWLDELRLQHR